MKDRLKVEKPQVMLVQETKVSGQKLQSIIQSFKLQYEVMEIDSAGMAGGLAILWNATEVIADGWISFPRIMTGNFRLLGSEEIILISAVYGPPIPGERVDFLQNIRTLSTMHQEKYWLLGGDFNMILNLSEKKRWYSSGRTGHGSFS